MHGWGILLLAYSVVGWGVPRRDTQVRFQDDFSMTSSIRDTLLANKVIGDVLDDFEPSYYLDISWPESHETVLLGNDIPVEAAQKRPAFLFHSINPDINTSKNTTFTLALTDPDAKSREDPKWAEMCHWIITNLTTPIRESPVLFKKAGELKGYKPPGPPPKTGAHRYVFVLLQGNGSSLSHLQNASTGDMAKSDMGFEIGRMRIISKC